MNKNKLQRNLSLVLVLSLLAPTVTGLPVFAEIPANTVENNAGEEYSIEDKFEDEGLDGQKTYIKGSIRSTIGLKQDEEITNKNILKLKHLELVRGIHLRNLNGLEYAKNLKSLKAEYGTIADLTALKDLPKFEELEITGGDENTKAVEKEDTLTQLVNLKKLNLRSNQITTLKQLSNLKQLEHLVTYPGNIKDPDKYTKYITNLDGIESFPNLKVLVIDGTGLRNLEEFKTGTIKTTLEQLEFVGQNINIVDATGLKELKHLKYFYMAQMTPEIIKNLAEKESLESIYFEKYLMDKDNPKADLEVFKKSFKTFKNLKVLDLTNFPIKDLSIAQEYEGLEKLYASGLEIEEIPYLGNLNNLTHLDLSYNNIKDLKNLEILNNLKYINLSSNQIEDITPLKRLDDLKSIDLYDNKITDITPIENLKGIVELNVSNNPIEIITNQKSWPNLGRIELSESKIKDISFISKYNLGGFEYKHKDFYGTEYISTTSFNMYDNNLEYTIKKRNQEILKSELPVTYYIKDKDGSSKILDEANKGFSIKDGLLQLANEYIGDKIELEYEITRMVGYPEYKDSNTGELQPAGEYPEKMKLGTIIIDTSNLKPAQALTYTPEIKPLQVEKGSKEVDYKKGISNLPEGSEVMLLEGEKPDLTKVGKQTVKVKITLKDGSYLETEIPIEVKITPKEIKPIEEIDEEHIEPEIIKVGDQIDLTDNIKNLPEGTTLKDITNPPIDTTKAGKYTATVEITYKDGSGTTIEIPVEIKELEANTYNPEIKVPKIEVKTGENVNLADLIEKTPEIKEIIEIKPIDTETEGIKEGLVKIIFNDGSEKEIPVKVEIKLKDKLPDNPVLPSNPETPANPDITTPTITYKPTEDTFHYGEIRIIDHTETQKPKEKESIKPEEKDNKSELDKIKADLEKEDKQITKKNQIIFKIGESSYKKITAGKEEVKQMDIAPFIEKDRTYLPIRNVAEALGLEVSYDNNTRTATFKQNNDTLQINIDTKKATKNGKPYVLEVDPIIKNGRLVAPVSVIGKAFNKTISNYNENKNTDIVWNNDTKEVIIYNYK